MDTPDFTTDDLFASWADLAQSWENGDSRIETDEATSTQKMCTRCKRELALTDFHSNVKTTGGLNHWCTDCMRYAGRRWRKANPNKRAAQSALRRARIMGATGTHTSADLEAIRAAQTDKLGRLRCWWCGKPIKNTPHVDHKTALASGGSNGPDNLCYSCAKCNTSKRAKSPAEFAGRLL